MANQVLVNYTVVLFDVPITVLQLCAKIGNHLPRFCYHSELPIAANCRMCLVQLEESTKPIAACAVAASNGMRVFTETILVKQARESVLEFLLINHPLDCPICDQGGECDLQDQTMVFGSDRGRFYEKKRAVKDVRLGVVVKTFMTRCIHCTRCIRFVQNLISSNELGLLGRGYNMRVTTFTPGTLSSVLAGNIADICPVGALTSKPYAFTARPWELNSHLAIDMFDALGGNIKVETRGVEVMRVLPYNNSLVNQDWATDKARLAFDGFTRQRLSRPILFRVVSKRRGPNRNTRRPNIVEFFHFLTKKLFDVTLSFILNKSLCKLIFWHRFYIGSVIDVESAVVINLVNELYSGGLFTATMDIFENKQSRFISTFRDTFFYARKINLLCAVNTTCIVGFNPSFEAPLLYLRLVKKDAATRSDKITKVLTKTVHKLGANYEVSLMLSFKHFMKILTQSEHNLLFGQAAVNRADFEAVYNMLHKGGVAYTLVPANNMLTSFLEIG